MPGVNVLVLLTVTLLKFPCEPPTRFVIVPDAVRTLTVVVGGLTGGTGFPPPVFSEPLTLKLAVPWVIVLLVTLLNEGVALLTTSVPVFCIVVAPAVPLTVKV